MPNTPCLYMDSAGRQPVNTSVTVFNENVIDLLEIMLYIRYVDAVFQHI